MTEKHDKFIVLIISTALYLMGTLDFFVTGYLIYFKYLAILIPVIYCFDMLIKIPIKNSIVLIWLFAYFIFEFVINLFNEDYIRISLYIIINIMFLLYISKVPVILNTLSKITSYIYYISVFILVILVVNFIREPIFNVSNNLINNVLINYGRERYKFGFQHANYLGSICFIYLANMVYLVNSRDLAFKRKILIGVGAVFIGFIMLMSGSRTATYSIVIFCIVLSGLKFIGTSYGKYFLGVLSVVIIFVLYTFISNLDIIRVLYSTNRFGPLQYNVIRFMKLGSAFTGIGFYNHMSIYDLDYEFIYIDNYYVYVFITQGFIGLGVMLVTIIMLFVNIFRVLHENIRYFLTALSVAVVVYSMFETFFFVPGVFSSYYYWTIVYGLINLNYSEEISPVLVEGVDNP